MSTEVAKSPTKKPPVLPTLSTEQFVAVIHASPAIVEAQNVAKQVKDWIGKGLKLTTAIEVATAGEWLKKVKASQASVEATRTSMTKPLNDLLTSINGAVRETSAPLSPLERSIKDAVIAYDQEQDRIRREAQRKLDEAAAAERKRIADAAAAAASKAAAEAQALRDKAKQAEEAGNLVEAQKLANKAIRTEDRGDEKRMQLEMQAETVVAPIINTAPVRVSGVVRKKVWTWKLPMKNGVEDASGIKPEFLIPNEPMITKMVKAVGAAAVTIIGGIICEQVDDIAGGRK